MEYFFDTELSEEERLAELEANLERGNHQSASQDEPNMKRLLHKDVGHGFALPVPKAAAKKM
jgi:hypothetical protein